MKGTIWYKKLHLDQYKILITSEVQSTGEYQYYDCTVLDPRTYLDAGPGYITYITTSELTFCYRDTRFETLLKVRELFEL